MERICRVRGETPARPLRSNPSTSGSDGYEKRIKKIDDNIQIAQSNVKKLDRQDDIKKPGKNSSIQLHYFLRFLKN